VDKGLEYLTKVRGLSAEEIDHWHILTSDEVVQFPVIDYAGRYAFTIKRCLDGSHKWDNPAEAPVGFRVFGLDHAVRPIMDKGYAVVVEGPFDVLAMHVAGYTNTVGAVSNNLTRWQAHQLRRWTDRLILVFDGDDGGLEGQKKTVEILKKFTDFKYIAVRLSNGDPDSLVRRGDNKGMLLTAMANAARKITNRQLGTLEGILREEADGADAHRSE